MENLGGGLAALAFWGFIASTVLGGIWYSIREKDAQHETLRKIIESGQKIDDRVVDKIMNGDSKIDEDLKIAAYIVLFVSPGLALLGWFLKRVSEDAFPALLGVAGLVMFVGLGLLAASKVAERSRRNRQDMPLP